MKTKLIALALVCTLLVGICSAAFAGVGAYNSSFFTKSDFSSMKSFEDTSLGRAVLATFAILEYANTTSRSTEDINFLNGIYYGKLASGAYDFYMPAASGNKYYDIVFWTDGSYDIYTFYYTSSELRSKYPSYEFISFSDLQSAVEIMQQILND